MAAICQRFLAALRNSGNVRAACRAAGVNRSTIYSYRAKSRTFARQWDEAVEEACDLLEAEAWRRAMKTSDTLLIFLLKAYRPEKYRENYPGRDDAPAEKLDKLINAAEGAAKKITSVQRETG